MRRAGMPRAKFRIQHNHLTFERLFLTDVIPYEFALACVAHNIVMLFQVRQGYRILPYLGDAYGPLRNALHTEGHSSRALDPSAFLHQIDAALPHTVDASNQSRPIDIGRIYRDVDEADKLYLCGWCVNNRTHEHVSSANLAKTLRLLGQAAHDFCQRRNVSTCWTDDHRREINSTLPHLQTS